MGLSSVEKNRVQRVDNKRDWAVPGGHGGLTEMAMLQREPEASEGRSHVDTGVEVGRALHAEGTTSAAALGEGSILVSSRKCGWNGSNQMCVPRASCRHTGVFLEALGNPCM